MPAKRPKRENTMEHVVEMRTLSANTAKSQREEHFYRGSPVKLQRKRELEKHILNASVTPETEKHYGTRGENANFECQHCKNTSENCNSIGVPCKTAAKTLVEKTDFECQRNARN
jgi:hypothetical protein